jgi:HAMP domain-containing protein
MAWLILTGTMFVTLVLGVLVAANLTRAITRPINILVNATRKIASGNLGYTVTYLDKTEFGELASHFNAMSNSLMTSYADLEEEINERKKAEEALRVSEERYALAARTTGCGWDLRNNKIHFSVRWKRCHCGERSIITRRLDRIHPTTAMRWRPDRRPFAAGTPTSVRVPHHAPDGPPVDGQPRLAVGARRPCLRMAGS